MLEAPLPTRLRCKLKACLDLEVGTGRKLASLGWHCGTSWPSAEQPSRASLPDAPSRGEKGSAATGL